MNLRKIFNSPNISQKKILEQQIEEFEIIADKRSSEHNKYEKIFMDRFNNTCSHCKNKDKDKIVNKIAQVHGSGSVSGSFIFGTSGVYGSSSIDTKNVRHCNVCGNEWKEYKTNFMYVPDIIKEYLTRLYFYIKNKDERENSWNRDAYTEISHFYAETIFSIFKKYSYRLSSWYKDELYLSNLRKFFSSIYDSI